MSTDSARSAVRLYLAQQSLRLILIFLLVSAVTLIIFPLAIAFFGAFWSAPPYEREGHLTLRYFRMILETPGMAEILKNTIVVAVVSTVISVGFGVSFALLMTRSRIPYRKVLTAMIYIPFIVPGYIAAAGWTFILAPRIGLLNKAIDAASGVVLPFYNEWGIALVVGTHYIPLVYFLVAPGIKKVNSMTEAASFVHGGTQAETLRQVTIPLSKPAILSTFVIIMVKTFEEFAIALFIGLPSQTYVISTKIFTALRYTAPPDYGLTTALAVLLVMFGIVLLTIETIMIGASTQYQTVSGSYSTERMYDWGPRGNSLIAAALFVFLFVFTIVPMLLIVYVSFKAPYLAELNLDLSLFAWRNLFANDRFITAIWNSVLLSVVGPALLMVFAFFASYLYFRTDLPGRKLLDYVSFVPLAVPSVVTAVGFLWVFLFVTDGWLYGTLAGIMLAMMSRYTPYATRAMHGGMAAISDTMEEASLIAGNGPLGTLKDIIFPLVRSNFFAGFILLSMFFMKNLTVVLFLYQDPWYTLSIEIWLNWNEGIYNMAAAGASVMIFVILLLAALVIKFGDSSVSFD